MPCIRKYLGEEIYVTVMFSLISLGMFGKLWGSITNVVPTRKKKKGKQNDIDYNTTFYLTFTLFKQWKA